MPDWKAYVRQNLDLRNLRPEREAEIVDDLAQQLEDAFRDGLNSGLTEIQADTFAREHIPDWQELSRNLAQSREGAINTLDRLERRVEDSRARDGWDSRFARLPQDLLFALRMMRKNPIFTAVAVLTLSLGIGANTAIFSVLNALLLHSAPARNPQQLFSLRWSAKSRPKLYSHSSYGDCQTHWTASAGSSCSFSLPFFRSLQQQTASPFAGLAGFAGAPRVDLSGNGEASIVTGQLVSGDYFSTLGVQPAAGRLIAPADDIPKSGDVVVLSYRYWQSAFGASASAIGKTIRLNSVPFTIIGVAEQRFGNLAVSTPYDLWLPLSANPQLIPNYDPRNAEADSWWVEIVARLRDDVPRKRAEADVSLYFRNAVIHGERPVSNDSDQPSLQLLPLSQSLGPSADKLQPVYVLALAVGLLLLIACANVAGLLLARATARRKEIAVRVAVGAARGHIVSQLLTESIVLSALGGSCGILVAIWALHAITTMISNGGQRPLPFNPSIDLRVLGFTAAVSIMTGTVFGIAPALRATHVDLNTAMKGNDSATGTSGERRHWLSFGNALVCVQVGLAIVLLIGAGLLMRTLSNLQRVNPGFDTHNILMFGIDARLAGYKDTQVDDLYRNLQQSLAAIGGVRQVSYSWRPLLRGSLWTHDVHFPGTPADARVESDYMAVGPGFLETMGIPILAGHEFTDSEFDAARKIALQNQQHPHDAPPTQPMPVIVNQKFAQQYLKGTLLGSQFGYENEGERRRSFGFEVVGIAGDAKYNDLRREIKPTMYVPSAAAAVYFEVRTALSPESLISSVRSTVSSVDGSLPVFDIKTQKQQIDEQLVSERTLARLSGFFGGLALLLASIGLYGLLTYDVAQRTHEIGVRMALGASQSTVIASIVERGMSLAAAGALAGSALGVAVVRLLRTLLYGVGPLDPTTLVTVAGLLLLVALAACTVPARRAAKVDPMISLRCE
jgi:predicted permease